MAPESVFKRVTLLVGAALTLSLTATLDSWAACSEPAGLEVDWQGCDLKDAGLNYKILSGANLVGADLSGANLEGVVLIRANLTDANLTGANLTDADLRDAVLSGVNLSGANLSGADLTGATWTDGRMCGEESMGECK